MALPPWARIVLYVGGATQAVIVASMYLRVRLLHAYVRVALLTGWALLCTTLAISVWYDYLYAEYLPLRDMIWTLNALVLCLVPTFCLIVTVRNGGK
jgi:hypothetical protein